MKKGKEELDVALKRVYNIRGEKDVSKLKRPKNVILFIGDGMSLTTVTAARIYRGQQKQQRSGEELYLAWEEFPETALLKVMKFSITPFIESVMCSGKTYQYEQNNVFNVDLQC